MQRQAKVTLRRIEREDPAVHALPIASWFGLQLLAASQQPTRHLKVCKQHVQVVRARCVSTAPVSQHSVCVAVTAMAAGSALLTEFPELPPAWSCPSGSKLGALVRGGRRGRLTCVSPRPGTFSSQMACCACRATLHVNEQLHGSRGVSKLIDIKLKKQGEWSPAVDCFASPWPSFHVTDDELRSTRDPLCGEWSAVPEKRNTKTQIQPLPKQRVIGLSHCARRDR